MDRPKRTIEWTDLGVVPYLEAWALQEKLREERILGNIPDRVLLVEHPAVFTMGRRDCGADFISSEDVVRAEGIEIVKTNRGGRVTYHGPGQLLCYFIFSLDEMGVGVKDFVRMIEEICIRLLARFGIESQRDPDHPGIWIGKDKIAAIGLNVTHGVTEHGFALNVDCDLNAYRHIVACGIQDRGVTTMSQVTGKAQDIVKIKKALIEEIAAIVGCHCERVPWTSVAIP